MAPVASFETKHDNDGRSDAAAADPDHADSHLTGPVGLPATTTPQIRILPIVNKRGLHARASARFVETVELFDAEVTIKRDGMSVGGLSIMGLLMLAASQGTTIEASATGTDANAVLDALELLLANRFGEDG